MAPPMFTVLSNTVAAISLSQALLYIFLALFVCLAYNYLGPPLWKKSKVFQEMNIAYVPPIEASLAGYNAQVLGRATVWDMDARQVEKYGKLFGKVDVISGPTLVIAKPELLRDVFVKEFGHFYNRRTIPPGATKLFANSLFSQRDQRWHDLRSLMSPTFSSAKMRLMDGLIRDCLQVTTAELDGRFEASKSATVEIDAKSYFSNFAMDVIGTVFFGVNVDAVRNPDNPFVKNSAGVFAQTKKFGVFLFLSSPTFVRKWLVKFGLTGGIGLPPSTRNYFEDVIPQMIRDRRKEISNQNVSRRDFLNVLIAASENATTTNQDLTATGTLSESNSDDVHVNAGAAEKSSKQSRATDQSSEQPVHTDSGGRKFNKRNVSAALTDDEIAAQCFIFIIAGFETTATAIAFLFHELALNQDVQEIAPSIMQDRLRAEVKRVTTASSTAQTQHLSYDTLAEMRFLDACITETLRLYPPITRLERQCAEDCVLSNGLCVKKGLNVHVPTWYIHRSAENFADPLKFDPDRFHDPERRAQIKPYTYMPFGQGPRNCVAMRFALLELKMIAAHVVQHYRIVPTERTVHPIPFQTGSFTMLRPMKAGAAIGLQQFKT